MKPDNNSGKRSLCINQLNDHFSTVFTKYLLVNHQSGSSLAASGLVLRSALSTHPDCVTVMSSFWQPLEISSSILSPHLPLTSNPASHHLQLLKWISYSFIGEAALKLLAALLAYQASVGGHSELELSSASAHQTAAARIGMRHHLEGVVTLLSHQYWKKTKYDKLNVIVLGKH